MNLTNRKISERQCFRMGLLETVTVSMVTIPYLTLTEADGYHIYALALGLLLAVAYGLVWFFYTTRVPEGYVHAVDNYMGLGGKLIQIIYVVRYLLRAGLLTIFFGAIVQEFLMRSFHLAWIVLPFAVLCVYGASRQTEGRGRLMEFLFWWIFAPLILMAVFAVSNVDWGELARAFGKTGAWSGVFRGAYAVLLALSPMELALYNLPSQKENHLRGYLRFLIWMILSISLAYIFIVGILGGGWAKSSATAAVNVMEAASLPGGALKRFDYPVMAFWILGVFATVSGFLQHAREHMQKFASVDTRVGMRWLAVILFVLFAAVLWLYRAPAVAGYLVRYLVSLDFFVGLLLPLVTLFAKRYGHRRLCSLLVFFLMIFSGVFLGMAGASDSAYLAESWSPREKRQASLENRDYAVSFSVEDAEGLRFSFALADLTEYKGEQALEYETYEVQADSLTEAVAHYDEERERQLDLGHLERIECSLAGEQRERLLYELGGISGIPKSVEVLLVGEAEEKIVLRELIKAAYGRESLR